MNLLDHIFMRNYEKLIFSLSDLVQLELLLVQPNISKKSIRISRLLQLIHLQELNDSEIIECQKSRFHSMKNTSI